MSSWRTENLGGTVSLNYGKSLPKRDRIPGDYPVYGSGGVVDYNQAYLVEGPGIVIGRKGTVGSVSYSDANFFPIDTTYYFTKEDTEEDLGFLYYALSEIGLDKLNTHAAVPGLNREVAYSQKISLPPKVEQKTIAHILKNYDRLIADNGKRIKILEEMTQAIYTEWFVNFRFPGHENAKFVDSHLGKIPNTWKIDKFGDHIEIKNGFAFKSAEYTDNGTKIVRTKDFSTSKFIDIQELIHISNESLEKYESYLLQQWDLLLIMVGASIGSYGIVLNKDLPALQNQNMWALRPKTETKLTRFFILGMMPELISKTLSFATGAARSFFRKGHFQNHKILIPENNVLKDYDTVVSPIWDEIANLLIKNENLSSTRDLLIPKLISGEIDVSELNIDVEVDND